MAVPDWWPWRLPPARGVGTAWRAVFLAPTTLANRLQTYPTGTAYRQLGQARRWPALFSSLVPAEAAEGALAAAEGHANGGQAAPGRRFHRKGGLVSTCQLFEEEEHANPSRFPRDTSVQDFQTKF